MSLAVRLLAEPVRSLAAGDVDVTYLAIGTAFDNPARIFFIQNLTDETVMISLDGVNDHFPLASSGFLLLDVTTNKTVSVGCFIAKETTVYAKQIGTPTTGAIYLSIFYGSVGSNGAI